MHNRIPAGHGMEKTGSSYIRFIVALCLLFCIVPPVSGVDRTLAAQQSCIGPASISLLERTIVLESGRKKPLAVYARHKLMQFSGKKRISGISAGEWFARMLFDPSSVERMPVFLINDPEIALALNIAPQPKRRYSYVELYPVLQTLDGLYVKARNTAAAERSAFDREIIRVFDNLNEYAALQSLLSFFDPYEGFRVNEPELALRLGFLGKAAPPSYADLLDSMPLIAVALKELQGKNVAQWSAFDSALVSLTGTMHAFAASIGNPIPHCIPLVRNKEERWVSPWGLVGTLQSAALSDPSLLALKAMKDAFANGDSKRFNEATRMFHESVEKKAGSSITLPDPTIELFFTKIEPFPRAKILFGLAAILALVTVFSGSRIVYLIGLWLTIAGSALTTLGLALRMIIMSRPPVTNLYETFVFVAWASAIIGLVLEWMRLRPMGVLVASLTGFLFLHIAGKYGLDGDTMGMLAAVLDSSFWLATHIVTIALGYAGCVGAGLLGHAGLIMRMLGKQNPAQLQGIERSVYGVLCFGLLFTIIGTVFGGMWADQAWGRFWGWDPKENGALLIILWCLVVIHARRAGLIRGIGTAIGAIIGTMLVMYTWIGVNLLGVGLHSYGFTAAGAQTLLIYTALELLFLALFALRTGFRKKTSAG